MTELKNQLEKNFNEFYSRAPQVIESSSGRIEFIGNHVDYNGGVVLGAALGDKQIAVALAKREDDILCFGGFKQKVKAEVSLKSLERFDHKFNWANYCLGIVKYFIEAGYKIDSGFDFLDISNLPSGAGLSSSAAIELAMCKALKALYNLDIDTGEMVLISKKCENEFMDMPCGILDQMVSAYGSSNDLVFIDCATGGHKLLDFPKEWKVWAFNSSKKHSLVEGEYAKLRGDCMLAAKILSEGGEDRLLVDFSMDDLNAKRSEMSETTYNRAKHIIEEIARVYEAEKALAVVDLKYMGELLTASHNSSSKLFGNSTAELDFLVEALNEDSCVYGARLSGGGFGGSVIALCDENFTEKNAEALLEKYDQAFQIKATYMKC